MQSENYRSGKVLEMLTVANEYCYFIENLEQYNKQTAIEFIQKIGPLLYLKASLLPTIEVKYPEANERFVTEEQWEVAFNALRSIFSDDDEFFYIPFKGDTDPIKGSLSENLADTYQDLKDFIMLYQKNTIAAQENAVAECKSLFELRWGKRLMSILLYLHIIKYKNNADEQLYDFI